MTLIFEFTQQEAEWLMMAIQELPMKIGVPLQAKLKQQAFEQIRLMAQVNQSFQQTKKKEQDGI
jgi:hypothetical protein